MSFDGLGASSFYSLLKKKSFYHNLSPSLFYFIFTKKRMFDISAIIWVSMLPERKWAFSQNITNNQMRRYYFHKSKFDENVKYQNTTNLDSLL